MSRQSIIDTAAAENGTKESPAGTNLTRYGAWYNLNGVPWCAIFVSWVYDKARHPLGKIDSLKGYHYCPSAYNYWKRNNNITASPQPGDIVLFDWNGDGTSDHTGIFVKWIVEGKTFTSWEGNTSVGNDSDGGQVMLRTRNCSTVKAFVNTGLFEDAILLSESELRRGNKNAEVSRIQKMLFDLKYVIVVDGDFGPATEKIVKQFQREHSIEVTGRINSSTEGALEAELHKAEVADKKTINGAFLKKGDSGVAVLALQKALNKKKVKPVLVEDGVFGSSTFTALKAFQKNKRLTVDGIAGPQTFKALGLNKI